MIAVWSFLAGVLIAAPAMAGPLEFGVVLPGDGLAAPPGQSFVLEVSERTLQLAPVESAELAGTGGGRLGPTQRIARLEGRGLVVDGELELGPLPAAVLREIPALWRVRMPPERSLGLDAVSVRVEGIDSFDTALTGEDGERLPVRAEPFVHGEFPGPDGERWLEGGVMIWIDVRELSRAGRYHGRLTIQMDGL